MVQGTFIPNFDGKGETLYILLFWKYEIHPTFPQSHTLNQENLQHEYRGAYDVTVLKPFETTCGYVEREQEERFSCASSVRWKTITIRARIIYKGALHV